MQNDGKSDSSLCSTNRGLFLPKVDGSTIWNDYEFGSYASNALTVTCLLECPLD